MIHLGKSWWAGPSAHQPASPWVGFTNTTRFYLTGQPGPTRKKRVTNGSGQNGPGWPILPPLVRPIKISILFCLKL